MTLYLNGFAFSDAKSFEPGTTWSEIRYAMPRQLFPRVNRDSVQSNSLVITFNLFASSGTTVYAQRELLRGLLGQGQTLIIRSDVQKLWGQSIAVFGTVLDYKEQEQAPSYWTVTASFEYKGNTQSHRGCFDVSTKQDFNDYAIAGVTTVGLPTGITRANDLFSGTPLTVVNRGADPVIHNWSYWDPATYTENATYQATIAFDVDMTNAPSNSVKLFDGATRVKGVDHEFAGDVTLQNGQCKWVFHRAGNTIDFYDIAGTLRETFSFTTTVSMSRVSIQANDDEYVAIMFDDKIVVELFRGRDLYLWPGAYVLVYSLSSAYGSTQYTVPTDNVLQLGTGGTYVSSNAYLKISTSKQVIKQTTGDPNPSNVTVLYRLQIFRPDATLADLATRKKEVLKRQG